MEANREIDMKNYIIATLIVIIVALSSIIYKQDRTSNYKFPILEGSKKIDTVVPLYLYVFFSKKNCIDCMEFIDVLNNLSNQFIVTGIVPESAFKEEEELRKITGATFPLVSVRKLRKKYIPWYKPSIVGVSSRGDVLFTLPGVPGEKVYVENFLHSLYNKYMFFP